MNCNSEPSNEVQERECDQCKITKFIIHNISFLYNKLEFNFYYGITLLRLSDKFLWCL